MAARGQDELVAAAVAGDAGDAGVAAAVAAAGPRELLIMVAAC